MVAHLLAGLLLLLAPQATDPFVGTFKDDTVSVTLRAVASGYEGTAEIAGEKYPIKAKRSATGIVVSLTLEGETYEYACKLEGDVLIVESEGELHRLKRVGPAQASTGDPSKNPLKKAKANIGEWSLFKHPVGVAFRHPGNWKVEKADESIYALKPIDAGSDEIFLATGTESFGIQKASDPQLAAGTDEIVATQIGAQFKRTGKPEAIRAAQTEGISLLYEGQGANGPVQIRVYSTVLKDMIISIVAIAPPAKMKGREETLKKIFSTVLLGAAEIDQALVGTWTKFSERTLDAQSSGGRRAGDASLVNNTNITVQLTADGKLTYRTQSHTIASGSGVFVESKQDDTDTASWAASNGKLIVMWGDGSEEFTYRIEGGEIILTGGGKETVWRRA